MSMVRSTCGTALVPLAASLLRCDFQLTAEAPCLACREPLSIHQPDVDAPERLLGTCDACGSWHLIDCGRAIMVLLPDSDAILEAEADR